MTENPSNLKVHLHFTAIPKFSFPLTIQAGEDVGIDQFFSTELKSNQGKFASSFHWSTKRL